MIASLLLGHVLNGRNLETALDATLTHLDQVLAASEKPEVLALSTLNRARPDLVG